VTELRVAKAASVKDEHLPVRFITGPKMKLVRLDLDDNLQGLILRSLTEGVIGLKNFR
jgi:hypothetical protein